MGKKAKEHRKKVAARNQRIKADQKKMQKVYQEMFEKQMNKLQEQFGDDLNVNVNGESVPFEVITPEDTPTTEE